MTDPTDETPPPRCSFCDKGHAEVRQLIAGHGAFICDECASLCAQIVGEPASVDSAEAALMAVYMNFATKGQWTLAQMTGVLMQLAADETASVAGESSGLNAVTLALNQIRGPRLRDKLSGPIQCGFCGKGPKEFDVLHAGFASQICGDCLEGQIKMRAETDLAYRVGLIARLRALKDGPALG
jgi:hypothetical protein